MLRQPLCFIGIVIATVCTAGIHGSLRSIPNIPCTQEDLTNMFGKCMILFSRGHGIPNIIKMRKSLQCDTSMINCHAVMQTRVCISSLTKTELSPACRPYINQVSDHQLAVFNIPCRVQHLRDKCMGFFEQHGLTQF